MSNPKFHVFLSHNSADKPAVEEVARRLKAEGMEPWLDKWHLIPGDRWMPAIEEVLAECASCAVFIGSDGIGTWQDEEMRAAINRRVTASRAADPRDRFRVIPVLLPGVARPERSLLPAFLVSTTWVEFRATLDEAEPFRRLVCGVRGVEPGDAPGQPILEGECPYRGLEFFGVAHARFFFGREALTEWLLTALRRTPAGQENRFLAVLGASGSGKSSLARAGLIPALKAGGLEGSADWPVAVVRPGADPLESLAVALSAVGGDRPTAGAVQALMADLRSSDNALHLTARLALRDAPPARRLVVLVDAFEEVFTLCPDESARTAFIDNLLRAAAVAGGQTMVVLTMRADFLGKCATHPALAAALSDHQALVGPMTEDELRRSIERPARRVGCEVEAGLVDVLIQDVQGQSGALPLMQYALLELWQRRDGRRLTLESYHAIGGLRGALERRANEVLSRFSEGERELCRRIFLRLTQPGEGTEDTKRRASYRELAAVGAEAESVQAVLRRLADARLITTEGDERRPGEGSVDVAHEALIRGWPELRKWIDADRSGLRTQRRLTEAAREWESNGRDASFLYGGARLATANEWAETHRAELHGLEAEFLSASVEAEGKHKADEVAKAKARMALERWRLRLTVALAATLLLAAVGVAVGALWYQRRAANTERDVTAALEEATALGKQAATLQDHPEKWGAALTVALSAVKRAEGVLNNGEGGEDLRARVVALRTELEAADKDRRMIARLEAARFQMAAAGHEGRFDEAGAVALYRAAFRQDDQDWDSLAPDEVAVRINQRAIRDDMLAALAAWGNITANKQETEKLRGVVQAADPDPASFRNRWNAALDKKDMDSLRRLATSSEAKDQPTDRLVGFASDLTEFGAAAEAVKFLKEANDRRPGDFWIAFYLAYACQMTKPPATDEAIRYYTAALMLRPNSAVAHDNLGIALFDKHQWDDAITEHRKAIQIKPDDAEAHTNLGNALYNRGQLDDAITEYRKAIQIQPDHADAHYNLGNALFDKHQWDEAITEYHKAIQIKPDDAEAHNNLGNALCDRHQLDEAIMEYRKAIELKPDDADAHVNLGIALRSKGRLDDAITEYRKALLIQPDHALGHNSLGLALREKGQWDEAIAEYRKALQIQPDFTVARTNLGTALQHEGQWVEAIAEWRKAVQIQPDDASLAYNTARATALVASGRGEDAAKTDEKERSRWREQALDFLGTALDIWTKKIDAANPEVRAAAAKELQHWKEDSVLAGVRDKDALAKLPADEQDAWRKLWADVDAALKKAQDK